jgi:hypothetical protein
MFGCPRARGRDLLIGVRSVISEAGRRRAPMCYTKKDRDLEREARRITERRLMEEEARHRHEDHHRRRREQDEENKPLTEKVKEVVSVK